MENKETEKTLLVGKENKTPLSYSLHSLNSSPCHASQQRLDSKGISDGHYVKTDNTENQLSDNDNNTVEPGQQNEKEGGSLKLGSLPKKNLITLLLISLGNFLFGMEFYFMTPFYPKMARKKGMSVTVLGFLFCVIHIIVFTTSPFLGNYLEKMGTRFLYITGIICGGIFTIIFGLVGMCAPGASFIAFSFVCRLLIGLCISAFWTASFAILTNAFPHHVSKAVGLAEIANGMGFMTGPALGGGLYELGGFGLPFYVVGILVFANGILLLTLMPPPKSKMTKRVGSIMTLRRSVLVLVSMLNALMGAAGACFLESTLATHLEVFNLSTGIVGLIFVLTPMVHAVCAPIVGYISDTYNCHHIQYYSGTLSLTIGYLLLGPSPLFVGLDLTLWLVVIGLMLIGYAYSSCAVPAIKCMVIGAIEIGLDDCLDTYGLVSGAFTTTICFGGFIGNVLGGVLVDRYGFPVASTTLAFLGLAVTLITFLTFTARHSRMKYVERDNKPKAKQHKQLKEKIDDSVPIY